MVWYERNQVIHGAARTDICTLVARVHQVYSSHIAVWHQHQQVSSPVWQPLDPGSVKINVDVATRPHFSMVACICRDFQRRVLHVETKRLQTVDPTLGEAEALWLGVQVADRFSWETVYFEGDPMIVMEVVSKDLSECPRLIEAIISRGQSLVSATSAFSLSFIPRCANYAAHSLAQWAASSRREGCFPEFCGLHSRSSWVFEEFDPP